MVDASKNVVKNPFKTVATEEPDIAADPVVPRQLDSLQAALATPGKYVSGEREDGYGEQSSLGKELAAIFKNNGVHPVLIFGSKGSGKTSLLASLFKYMQDQPDAGASIELAEDLYPEDERWNDMRSWGRDIFHRKMRRFMEDGEAPPTTQEHQPFFIPVRLTLSSGQTVCFAFLEGKGEWYQPDETAEVPFKKFRGLIDGALQAFTNPTTVLYIAPFVTGSDDEPDDAPHLRNSDLGLQAVLSEYIKTRRGFVHLDQHMFVVTKWDVYCQTVGSMSFDDPSEEELTAVLERRYRRAWTKFQVVNMSGDVQNRSYSAYCAGLMSGRAVAATAEEDADRVAYYPRKLWNFVYQNATGQPMFEEFKPRKQGFLDWLLALIRG